MLAQFMRRGASRSAPLASALQGALHLLLAWWAACTALDAAPGMRALLRRLGGPPSGSGLVKHPSFSSSSSASAESPAELLRYYALDPRRLPEGVRDAYRPLAPDAETAAFLASCRPSVLLSLAAKLLRLWYSVTDANGILGRGQMFVASTAHYRDLLAGAVAAAAEGGGGGGGGAAAGRPTLLDVGAGDGDVTARLAPLFAAARDGGVTVTEVSAPMARRLAARGYATHVTPFLTPDAFPDAGVFDVVSIHNVLDRCDHPRELLRGALRLLRPGSGRLLLAVVLPFCEFVEDGTARRPANGPLPMSGARCGDGASFEASLGALITRVLWPLGLTVERVAKLPYLCRGNLWRPYYVLADAVLVCRQLAEGELPQAPAGISAGAPSPPPPPGGQAAAGDAGGGTPRFAAAGAGGRKRVPITPGAAPFAAGGHGSDLENASLLGVTDGLKAT